MREESIAIVGGGNMGKAIITGLINSSHPPQNILLIELDDKKRAEIEDKYKIRSKKIIDEETDNYQIIITAVKPNNLKGVLKAINSIISSKHLIISCVAGVPIDFIERQFDKPTSIVRIMPNIAAVVGMAAVAICYNSNVNDNQKATAKDIIGSIGTVTEVEEDKMDAVTGLSGSGPAFVFLMIEALSDGGVLMGIPRKKALELSIQTVYGASALLKESNIHPALAIEMVTSPGGTTIEGLLSLEEGGFKALIMNAVKSATEKSKHLGLINEV